MNFQKDDVSLQKKKSMIIILEIFFKWRKPILNKTMIFILEFKKSNPGG